MSENENMKYTIAVDFDGVLHSYASGYQGWDIIADPPVPGAVAWLNGIVAKFEVVIFTTRAAYGPVSDIVDAWLRANGYDGPNLRTTATKPLALIYLDDRAMRFEGIFPTAKEIHRALPWRAGAKRET